MADQPLFTGPKKFVLQKNRAGLLSADLCRCPPQDKPPPTDDAPSFDQSVNFEWCRLCDIKFENSKEYNRHCRGLIHSQKLLSKEKDAGLIQPDPEPRFTKRKTAKRVIKLEAAFENPVSLLTTDAGKRAYSCKICEFVADTEATMSMHVYGKKHKKMVKTKFNAEKQLKLSQGAKVETIETGQPAVIQAQLADQQVSVIGAGYVVEFLPCSLLEDEEESRYVCTLCDVRCDPRNILTHLTGYKHKLTYFKEVRTDYYADLMFLRDDKVKQNQMVDEYAQKVQDQEGMGTVCQKTEAFVEEVFVDELFSETQPKSLDVDRKAIAQTTRMVSDDSPDSVDNNSWSQSQEIQEIQEGDMEPCHSRSTGNSRFRVPYIPPVPSRDRDDDVLPVTHDDIPLASSRERDRVKGKRNEPSVLQPSAFKQHSRKRHLDDMDEPSREYRRDHSDRHRRDRHREDGRDNRDRHYDDYDRHSRESNRDRDYPERRGNRERSREDEGRHAAKKDKAGLNDSDQDPINMAILQDPKFVTLLSKMASGRLENDDEAKAALEVSSSLTQALLKYRLDRAKAEVDKPTDESPLAVFDSENTWAEAGGTSDDNVQGASSLDQSAASSAAMDRSLSDLKGKLQKKTHEMAPGPETSQDSGNVSISDLKAKVLSILGSSGESGVGEIGTVPRMTTRPMGEQTSSKFHDQPMPETCDSTTDALIKSLGPPPNLSPSLSRTPTFPSTPPVDDKNQEQIPPAAAARRHQRPSFGPDSKEIMMEILSSKVEAGVLSSDDLRSILKSLASPAPTNADPPKTGPNEEKMAKHRSIVLAALGYEPPLEDSSGTPKSPAGGPPIHAGFGDETQALRGPVYQRSSQPLLHKRNESGLLPPPSFPGGLPPQQRIPDNYQMSRGPPNAMGPPMQRTYDHNQMDRGPSCHYNEQRQFQAPLDPFGPPGPSDPSIHTGPFSSGWRDPDYVYRGQPYGPGPSPCEPLFYNTTPRFPAQFAGPPREDSMFGDRRSSLLGPVPMTPWPRVSRPFNGPAPASAPLFNGPIKRNS